VDLWGGVLSDELSERDAVKFFGVRCGCYLFCFSVRVIYLFIYLFIFGQ